jgi:hypothetical protein
MIQQKIVQEEKVMFQKLVLSTTFGAAAGLAVNYLVNFLISAPPVTITISMLFGSFIAAAIASKEEIRYKLC